MNKFSDTPYHLFLTSRETLEAYWWLQREILYPERNQRKHYESVTKQLRGLLYIMTDNKKKQEKSNAATKSIRPETIWLTVKLKDSDEGELSEYGVSALQIVDDLLTLVAEGGSFTLKQSANDESFNAFAFLPPAVDTGTIYAISAYALNPADALLVLHYKLYRMVGNTPDKYLAVEKRRFG